MVEAVVGAVAGKAVARLGVAVRAVAGWANEKQHKSKKRRF